MPKRVESDQKRVKLNCLVAPQTMEWLKATGMSQGESVDHAVTATLIAEASGNYPAEKKPKKLSRRDQEVAARAATDLTAQKVERDDIDYSDVESTPTQHVATLDAVSHSAGSTTGKASLEPWRYGRKPLLKPKERK